MPSLENKGSSVAPATDVINLPGKMPRIPDEVLDRFPEMEDYQAELDRWWQAIHTTLSETNEETSTVVNQNYSGLINISLTVDGVTASIVELAEVVADGFGNLSGKYTLTVTAGDVVTGMNITSSTGPGVNISEVAFQADKFQIYSGTTKKVMFVADAINDYVKLADTLVVDAANGKVYIGAGNYGNADTAWFVDDTGRMSLKDKLTWDGSTLTIVGDINATTGTIGGFSIGADYIRDNANNFGLASTEAGAGDIRLWAGDTFANRATAPFWVDDLGSLRAGGSAIFNNSGTDARIRVGYYNDLSSQKSRVQLWSGSGTERGEFANESFSGTNADVTVVSFAGDVWQESYWGDPAFDPPYYTLLSRSGYFDMNVPLYNNGVQVVTTQQAAIPDSAQGDENADRINDILGALRTHGLIAT